MCSSQRQSEDKWTLVSVLWMRVTTDVDNATTDLSADLSQEEMLARIRRLQIRARRLVRLLFLGEYHSVFRGRGLEFSEVREYQPGAGVRLVEWNVDRKSVG